MKNRLFKKKIKIKEMKNLIINKITTIDGEISDLQNLELTGESSTDMLRYIGTILCELVIELKKNRNEHLKMKLEYLEKD